MKKIKSIMIITITVLMLLSWVTISKAASSDLYLNSLNYDVQINSDGSMDIVETWNIDIEDTNTLFKTFKKDNSKYSSITDGKVYKIDSTGKEVLLTDSKEYSYHVPTNSYYFLDTGSEYEVAWGTGYEDSKGTESYKLAIM